MFDLLVLGSGVAGLSAAIRAARTGRRVLVLTKGELSSSTTWFAQGGIAAALTDADSPALHLADTQAAGAGLCDPDAVRILVSEGPARVRDLMALGAVFDRTGDGDAASLALAREGGHSTPRVVHAGGDATGAEIERALVAAVRALDGVEVREGCFTAELRVDAGRCTGAAAFGPDGHFDVEARDVVLATGGAGQMFSVTTNPSLSTGDGLAMAHRIGAVLADMEFMQFHPTALHHPVMPRPLLSEALRGEGAVLRDERGVAFMAAEHPLADLAPRDVVSRAIASRLRDRGLEHLWLDATTIDDFPQHFPTIWRACRDAGLDPTTEWLPVAPAAHYLCGGVATDLDGATTVPGLWACGEVACSGVHGANRLASNSLLDGLVFAPRIVDAIERGKRGADATGVLRGVAHHRAVDGGGSQRRSRSHGAIESLIDREELQALMTADAGVLRDAASLERVRGGLASSRAFRAVSPADMTQAELGNLVEVASLLVEAARVREESRGTHTRLDFADSSAAYRGRFAQVRGRPPGFVALPTEVAA